MIKEVVASKHLTPASARLTGNAMLALSAPVRMKSLMDTEDALDALDFVAKKTATGAEKRNKEDEEQAALEEASEGRPKRRREQL